ncbi:MAG: ATP-binding protein [Sulfurovum sp.]
MTSSPSLAFSTIPTTLSLIFGFKNTLDNTDAIIVLIDKNGVMVKINKYGENFVGYTEEEISSKPFFWDRFLNPNIRDKVVGIVENAKEGELVKSYQNGWFSRTGEERIFEWSNSLVRNIEDDMEYIVSVGIDVTEQKEFKDALIEAKKSAEDANKAKSEFLSNMSHEIRTPLNGIIGLTNLVLRSDLNRIQRDYLGKSITASNSLLNIINDILDYSKIEANKLEIESIPFEINKVFYQLCDLFDYEIEKKSIEMRCIIDKKLKPNLIGDPFRITQVLTNLLGNAIKFTHEGIIEVKVGFEEMEENELKLCFSIKDSGIGISIANQTKLFKTFSQADTSNTREYGGSGLGLTISKNLIELMGGEIRVESVKGEGSTFSFDIVLQYDKECNGKKYSTKIEKKRQSIYRGRVLLVEDNEINQIVASQNLDYFGLEVINATNGEIAVKKAKNEKFDIIFMDLQMPIMDGFEAAKKIREFDTTTPIIAISAAVMKDDREKTYQAGMNGHIAKPIDVAQLEDVVRDYLTSIDKKPHKKGSIVGYDEVVEGIDINTLLKRFNYNRPLLYSSLVKFAKNIDILDRLTNLDPASEEFDTTLHSLKGISGNLSLVDVHRYSTSIYESESIEEKKRVLPKLKKSISTIFVSIERDILPRLKHNEKKSLGREDIIKIIDNISEDIKIGNFIENSRIERLIELSNKIDKTLTHQLEESFTSFNYKESERLLTQLKGDIV